MSDRPVSEIDAANWELLELADIVDAARERLLSLSLGDGHKQEDAAQEALETLYSASRKARKFQPSRSSEA